MKKKLENKVQIEDIFADAVVNKQPLYQHISEVDKNTYK